LRRDRSHRVLGGVCAGIARTYGIDVVLVRVLFIIAGIAWIGIPIYIVAWIALPADSGPNEPTEPRDLGLIAALGLIGIGALIFVHQVLPHSWTNGGGLIAPLLLIGGGAAILVLRRPVDDDEDGEDDRDNDDELPPAAAAPAPPATVSPADHADTLTLETPELEPDDDVPPTAWTQTQPWASIRDERRRQRREMRAQRPRPFLTPLTLSVLLIGAGIASFLQATGLLNINLAIVFAIGTCIVGAALIASAWVGRARGLIAIGLLLAVAAGITTTLDVPLSGGFGAHTYTPATAAELQSHYKVGAGSLRLDLTHTALGIADYTVNAQVGAGELNVLLPPDQHVVIDSHVGAGDLDILGSNDNGWDVDKHGETGIGLPGTLHLILRVGAGHIQVTA
jgi:phage shock protein PspC (stress-responsive transcriptional regulator)